MKKSLSLLLALAMVFGMFASMASAADSDLTTEQKYQQLVDKGVLKGTTDGLPHLDKNLTRAEFATIAVAIAGLTPATGTTSAFSDVNSTQWWFGAIQAAADAGLVNGTGNGKFTPKANVTVQEVIKVATTIAKLTPVEGAKVEGSADWAGPFIQAAIDAGLPISSNYKAAATRGQTIDVAYAVFASLQVKPLSDVKAVLNTNDTITVTGKTVGADSVKVAIGTGTAAAATLAADGTFTYTTAAQSAGTYTLTVTAYKGETSLASTTASVTVDGFSVVSATVLNGKQIAVKFNKAVQEGVAQHGHNYSTSYYDLGGTPPANVTLSDDKTTVTLTFASAFVSSPSDSTYKQLFVSSNLYSASGKALTEYKQPILLSDSTSPTVTGVSYEGKTATITFSEPIGNFGTVSVNGAVKTLNADYTTPVNSDTGLYNTLVVSLAELATDYSFALVGGTDLVGNRFSYTATLNAPNDTTAPSVVSVTVKDAVVTAKFSEKISNPSQTSIFQTGSASTAVYGEKVSDTEIKFNVAGWLGSTGTFLTSSVTIAGYKDVVNLTGANYVTSVTIARDTTDPTIESIFNVGTKVVIKFSEALQSGFPTQLSYTFTNTNNVLKSNLLATNGAFYDIDKSGGAPSGNDLLYVAYDVAAIDPGKYVFTIPSTLGNQFLDLAGRSAAATTTTLTVTAGSSSTGSVTVNVYTRDSMPVTPVNWTLKNNQIRFIFNETLTPASLALANFTIDGVALPDGTSLTFIEDQKNVVATLPAGSISVEGTRLIKVAGVVAESGNTMSSTNSGVVTLRETIAPVATSITLSSDSKITVNFSEALAGAEGSTVSNIEVYLNTNKQNTNNWTFKKYGSTIVIEAPTGTFNASQTIQVKFVSTSATDISGNAVVDATITKQ